MPMIVSLVLSLPPRVSLVLSLPPIVGLGLTPSVRLEPQI